MHFPLVSVKSDKQARFCLGALYFLNFNVLIFIFDIVWVVEIGITLVRCI